MIIRDPIHKNIEIKSELVIKLIRTKEFQRLRRIKQLGLTYLIYPGAEHTRYGHSIGVYFIASRIVEKVEEKRQMFFEKHEKEALLISTLLHDIGHGPMSHATEELFGYDHEEYSVKVIQDESTMVNKILKEAGLVEEVVSFIDKTHPNKQLKDILSSIIDADRMDYLLRDSHYAGVVYGTFDLDQILKSIDIDEGRVIYQQKAVHTIEDYLLARYQMFQQVYLNSKTLKFESLVKVIFERLVKLHQENYQFISDVKFMIPLIKGKANVEEYLAIDDGKILTLLSELENEQDEQLRMLAAKFNNFEELETTENPMNTATEIELKMEFYQKDVCEGIDQILIRCESGSVKPITEFSKLVNFIKKDLKIEIKAKREYLQL